MYFFIANVQQACNETPLRQLFQSCGNIKLSKADFIYSKQSF